MINIVGKRYWFFALSAILIVIGIVFLSAFPLKLGVEFQSGSELTAQFAPSVTKAEIVQALTDLGYGSGKAVVRAAGSDYIIDLPELTDDQQAALRTGLTDKLGQYTDKGIQKVSAATAATTTRNAAIAVAIAAIGMLLYISWAFHKMPNPFRWGTVAIIAMVHDLLVSVGIFAIFAAARSWRIDLLFVIALLTVVGYSVNDTIVIFDRIRENVRRYPGVDFEALVNKSLSETMGRSLNTVLTTLFGVIALLLFVGSALQNFVVILLVGVASGAYSSIFTAAPFLVVWEKREWGRFIGRKAAA
jgi:preprotein translocase subunit SecF